MNEPLERRLLADGLKRMTVGELLGGRLNLERRHGELRAAVQNKCNGIIERLVKAESLDKDAHERTHKGNRIAHLFGKGATERKLVKHIEQMNNIVWDSVCGHYSNLPVLAFAYFISALHYFMKIPDRKRDDEMRGYDDDYKVVSRIARKFHKEMDQYNTWKRESHSVQLHSA